MSKLVFIVKASLIFMLAILSGPAAGFNRWSRTVVTGVFVLIASTSMAQTTANGPYYATPSWDQTMPSSTRFVVLANFNNAAVLDRETGIVWQRSPSGYGQVVQAYAANLCASDGTGGRMGWRLPSVSELTSLFSDVNYPAVPPLPAGHPFTGFDPTASSSHYSSFWASNGFYYYGPMTGAAYEPSNSTDKNFFWCVRGPGGQD